MPASYGCDNCDVTADNLNGWLIVPNPPGGRTLASTVPDLMFHDVSCRDAWCEKAGITPPAS
jgi:hypothetical protein